MTTFGWQEHHHHHQQQQRDKVCSIISSPKRRRRRGPSRSTTGLRRRRRLWFLFLSLLYRCWWCGIQTDDDDGASLTVFPPISVSAATTTTTTTLYCGRCRTTCTHPAAFVSSSSRHSTTTTTTTSSRRSSFVSNNSQLLSINTNVANHHHNNNCHVRVGGVGAVLVLSMGLQIKIRMVGREKSGSRDRWIQPGCEMYSTRLRSASPPIDVETEWHKTDAALIRGIQSDVHKVGAAVVVLDPDGRYQPTSDEFATRLYDWLERGGSRLVFVIGGAEGLPPPLKSGHLDGSTGSGSSSSSGTKSLPLLSLSKLTLTHQFARLLLVEQIYRASEIRRGSNYHK